jgi:dethiobiotin synthetase
MKLEPAVARPDRLVVVLGTGTEVGKTWITCRLIEALVASGLRVAARKPAQSFAAADHEVTDAELLAQASGEQPHEVCPTHRWYPVPLAPPMAAERLGWPPVHLHSLVHEVRWPAGMQVGIVETAGGARSPVAVDGDSAGLASCLAPDLVLVVADAGLGTINGVRSALDAVPSLRTAVVLNRFDTTDALHQVNAAWLSERDGATVLTDVGALVELLGP